MTPAALLADLRRLGCVLRAEGGDIVADVPAGALTPTDAASLRQWKPAILALLERERAIEDAGRRFLAGGAGLRVLMDGERPVTLGSTGDHPPELSDTIAPYHRDLIAVVMRHGEAERYRGSIVSYRL
ncbi:MAG: hypothetical protein U0556_04035 [Dehalococcoidia bacterium]